MNRAIEGLAPALLWNRFYEISQIPRPSKHEERIRLYLRNFAGKHGLEFNEDKTGNIVINIPHTTGFDNAPTIIVQGHVDMVCEKNKDTVHDFENDPIKLIRQGEWLKADGTTLGADNGIGVAAALAIVEDDTSQHGPLELLFTVDEETGLTGANTLTKDFIKGKYLLNLDTEEDGAFYVGCAGGMDTLGVLNIEFVNVSKDYLPYKLFLSGLKGGHSGINISDGRANAVKLIGYLLSKLDNIGYQLGYLTGGSKRNAIAREAEALLWIDPSNEQSIRESINAFAIETSLEYKTNEPEIKISLDQISEENISHKVYSERFTKTIIDVILSLPHGVISMSADIPGLVETSTNLATVVLENNSIKIGTSQRSSIESAKRNIANSVKSVFNLAGANVVVGDGYPGWQPNMNSELLKISTKVYNDMFDTEPEIKAVHAGLECGILGDKYPGLDMISFGPTIIGAHSPDEKVKINDVEKFYDLLKRIITEIGAKKIRS